MAYFAGAGGTPDAAFDDLSCSFHILLVTFWFCYIKSINVFPYYTFRDWRQSVDETITDPYSLVCSCTHKAESGMFHNFKASFFDDWKDEPCQIIFILTKLGIQRSRIMWLQCSDSATKLMVQDAPLRVLVDWCHDVHWRRDFSLDWRAKTILHLRHPRWGPTVSYWAASPRQIGKLLVFAPAWNTSTKSPVRREHCFGSIASSAPSWLGSQKLQWSTPTPKHCSFWRR